MSSVNTWRRVALASYITAGTALTPLYCKQDIFIFYKTRLSRLALLQS